jgi:hypothetical protein
MRFELQRLGLALASIGRVTPILTSQRAVSFFPALFANWSFTLCRLQEEYLFSIWQADVKGFDTSMRIRSLRSSRDLSKVELLRSDHGG